MCYQGRKNFGPLLYAIQERLQGCHSSPRSAKSDYAAILDLALWIKALYKCNPFTIYHKQRIVREAVVTRDVKRWGPNRSLSDVDWDSSSDVSVFTDVVTYSGEW